MNGYSFAIIGHGYMATRHIKAIDNQPRASVRVIINRGRVVKDEASPSSAETFGDPAAVCRFLTARRDIHAIIICAPDHLHADFVLGLLASDKVIFCEKPLARTEDEFRTLLRAAKADGKARLAIGMNCRFRSRIQYLRELRENGGFGALRFVNAAYYSNITSILDGKAKGWWFEYPRGTLPFLHGGAIHLFDALRFVVGEVEEVWCAPVPGQSAANLGGDSFIVLCKFTNGVIATITITGTSLAPNRFQIAIEGARRTTDDTTEYVLDEQGGDPGRIPLAADDYKDLDRQLAHVIDILDGKVRPLNDIDQAYKNFRMVQACERSAASGSWTRVDGGGGFEEISDG